MIPQLQAKVKGFFLTQTANRYYIPQLKQGGFVAEDLIKEDITVLKTEVATLSGRVNGIEKMMTWLMVLIVVAVGLPQVIPFLNKCLSLTKTRS